MAKPGKNLDQRVIAALLKVDEHFDLHHELRKICDDLVEGKGAILGPLSQLPKEPTSLKPSDSSKLKLRVCHPVDGYNSVDGLHLRSVVPDHGDADHLVDGVHS